jgi:hypothetical protein
MPNLLTPRMLLADLPFEGAGVSLYAGVGAIRYRNPAVIGAAVLPSGSGKLGKNPIPRTERLAFVADPDTELRYTLPAEWLGQTVLLNLRPFADGIENDGGAAQQITLDGAGELVSEIRGTAILIGDPLPLDGGGVRIRFRFFPSIEGIPPEEFHAIKTAGSGTVEDGTVAYARNQKIYEIDTPALTDGGSYTFKIQAVAGTTVADLITGIAIVADAAGPPAASGLTIRSA